MKFSDLISTIQGSAPQDWITIPGGSAGDGPSYRNAVSKSHGPGGWELEVESHLEVAVFKDDVSLTLAWGLQTSERMNPLWLEKFATAKHLDYYCADVFWNGALVSRVLYTYLDLEDAYLPIPWTQYEDTTQEGTPTVTAHEHSLTRLVHRLSKYSEDAFDRTFAKGGFQIEG